MRYLTQTLLAAATAALLSTSAMAADPLAGTSWRTIDEKTGQAKGQVTFSERGNVLSGTITKRYAQTTGTDVCKACPGAYKNKPYIGLPVVTGLRAKGNGEYADGKILDPQTGKTYNLKGKLSADGKTFEMRAYMGVSLLGRNQVWQREN